MHVCTRTATYVVLRFAPSKIPTSRAKGAREMGHPRIFILLGGPPRPSTAQDDRVGLGHELAECRTSQG